MRFALADTVTVSLHFVCKTYLYSAPKGKWRNAPKGVFRFFHNYERLATVFTPLTTPWSPAPSGGEYPPHHSVVPSPAGGELVLRREQRFCPQGEVAQRAEGGEFFYLNNYKLSILCFIQIKTLDISRFTSMSSILKTCMPSDCIYSSRA